MLQTFNTYTSRGSLGAKMEAEANVRALSRRLQIHSEDITNGQFNGGEPKDAIRTIESLIRQVTEVIQRVEWAESCICESRTNLAWNSGDCPVHGGK